MKTCVLLISDLKHTVTLYVAIHWYITITNKIADYQYKILQLHQTRFDFLGNVISTNITTFINILSLFVFVY
jgi:hypothetical protein